MNRLKITAPASSVNEVEMLHHFGADEIYCGINTPEWQEHFGGFWWMNRRSPVGANLNTWQDIKNLATTAHDLGLTVHVTLNAPFYPQSTLQYLLKVSDTLISELQVDSFIVSDITLLILLQREKLPVKIHLSSLGSCFNSGAVDFYRSLGVDRIILPRQLRLFEIHDLLKGHNSDMEFEVFALNDGCFFEEGFCQTTHSLNGPFCLTDWEIKAVDNTEAVSDQDIADNMQEMRQYRWYLNNCGSSFQQDGLPNGPCSLCWFGYFRDWGVESVKIVGREASFLRKMRSLQLVKAVMDETRSGASPEKISQLARSLRGTPEYCQKGYMCYFAE